VHANHGFPWFRAVARRVPSPPGRHRARSQHARHAKSRHALKQPEYGCDRSDTADPRQHRKRERPGLGSARRQTDIQATQERPRRCRQRHMRSPTSKVRMAGWHGGP
jgi:hypothetical protein